MAVQMLGIKTKFTDDQGRPLIGGSVHTYYAGTSLPQDTFSDPELTVPNTNPVKLDDTGSANIFLKGTYRVRVFDREGKFIEEQDNVDQLATVAEVFENKGGLNAANERIDALTSEVNSVKEKTLVVDSIADLSTINNPKDGLRVYVKSYHAGLGKGGGYFTYDSTKATDNDGGSVINGWVRDIDTDHISICSFGASPEQEDNAPFINAALDFAWKKSATTKVFIDVGEYIVNQSILIPPNRSVILYGSGWGSVVTAKDATEPFDVFKAPDNVAYMFSISNIRIAGNPNGESYAIDFSQCRNGSRIENLTITGGINGVKFNANWYASVENVRIYNCTNHGIEIVSTNSSDTINAMQFGSLWLSGCKHNIYIDSTAASSVGLTFKGLTSEKSLDSSIYIKRGIYAVSIIGGYFENNGIGMPEGSIADIYTETTVNLVSCSFVSRGNNTHIAGGTGLLIVGDGTYISNPSYYAVYHPLLNVKEGHTRGGYYDNSPQVRRILPFKNKAVQYGPVTASSTYLSYTVMPLLKRINHNGRDNLTLWELDLTTTVSREHWTFDLDVSTLINSAVGTRAGSKKIRVMVFKVGSTYTMIKEDLVSMLLSNSDAGSVQTTLTGTKVTIEYKPVYDANSSMVTSTLTNFICNLGIPSIE